MIFILSSFVDGFKLEISLLNKYPKHKQIALFIVSLAISFLIFFFRNPDPFINPVFLTEDGRFYVGPILSQGFWSALWNARSDYLVLGNLVLIQIAIVINNLFEPGSILHLPEVIAIISYLFYATLATLPILLFFNKLKLSYLLALTLVTSFFPLHDSDFEVIGRISNVGYAFVYIAFLLIGYRLFSMSNWRSLILIDLLIVVCACTNPVVYLIVPSIYFPILNKYFYGKISIKNLLNDYSFISTLFITIVLVVTILLMAVNDVGNYKQTSDATLSPFVMANGVEMIIARSILYPIIYTIYPKMNDVLVIFVFIIISISFVKLSNKNNHGLYILGLYCLLIFSFAAAIFRPGLSGFLDSYSSTWPDRYYYGQNLLAIFLIVMLFNDISYRLNSLFIRRIVFVLMLTIFLSGAGKVSTYGNPANPLREIGNFEQTLVAALKEEKSWKNSKFIDLPIYWQGWRMTIPRRIAENSAAQGTLIHNLYKCDNILK